MSKNHNPKHRHSPKSKEAKKRIDPNYIKSAHGYLHLKVEVMQDLRFIQKTIGSKKTKDFTLEDIELFLKNGYNAEKITVGQINESYDENHKPIPEPNDRYYHKFYPQMAGKEIQRITENYVCDHHCFGIYRIKLDLPVGIREEQEPKDALIFIGTTDGIHSHYTHIFTLSIQTLGIFRKLSILGNLFPDLE